MKRSTKAASALIILAAASAAYAAPGTYTLTTSGGLWSNTANWSGGTVADGSDNLADFSTLDITADNTVHLDSARTIGSLTFGDTTTTSVAGWTLDNNANAANILTLAGTTPTITVNALGGTKVSAITAQVAGTSGLTKAGAGILMLTGTQLYTGGTTVSAGTLQLGGSSGLDATVNGTITVNSGATLSITGGATRDFTNTISGAGKVSKGSTSVVTLTAQNTFTGGVILAGAGASALYASDSQTYSGDVNLTYNGGLGQPLTSVVGVTVGGGTTLGLRANGQDDSTTQTLTYLSNYTASQTSMSLTQSGGGGTYTINVNRQGGTGTNKVLAIGGRTALVRNGTLAVTGANGYSLKLAALQFTSGNADGQLWTINPTSASVSIGDVTMPTAYNATLVLDGTAVGNAITGVISNNSGTKLTSLTKSNSSTWTLSGNNSYTGTTSITGGKLLVNGSLAAGSAVTVNGTGAILGGSGTIGGPVTISSGAIAPGNSAGQLNLSGALTIGASGTYLAEVADDTKDLLAVGGALDLSATGNTLDVTFSGTQTQSRYVLATYTGTRSGIFDNLVVHNYGGTGTWTQDYSVDGQIAIVVPEPGTMSLAAGMAMLALSARRRSRKA